MLLLKVSIITYAYTHPVFVGWSCFMPEAVKTQMQPF